jgi:Ubiquinone biosynthesis protein COQ7
MKEIEYILKLDHAGGYGAINIYSAQLLIARLFYKDIVFKLEEMLSPEREHYKTFNNLLLARSTRPFSTIKFWAEQCETSLLYKPIFFMVKRSTEFAIWLPKKL